MDDYKNISSVVIKRLPRYYRYLGDLLAEGITRISSKDLSEKMNVTASQIRQDLNNFGCFGQQGYGYKVQLLHDEIRKILGLNQSYNLIIVGVGNIGQALANYINFQKRGFNFIGMFDVNPKIIGMTVRGVEIRDFDTVGEFIKNNKVDIAVLSLSQANAVKAAQVIIQNGVKGIWNFSAVELITPPDVVVENVHLTDSLLTLSYRLKGE